MTEKEEDVAQASSIDDEGSVDEFIKTQENLLKVNGDSIQYSSKYEQFDLFAPRQAFERLVDPEDEEITGVYVTNSAGDEDDEHIAWINLTKSEKGIRVFAKVGEDKSLPLVAPKEELEELLDGEKQKLNFRVALEL